MNSLTRTRLYAIVAARDGEYCRCCGALSHERELILDHKDNNNSNNSLENLQILCRRCNYLKNPRRPVDECVSVCESNEQTSELKVNRLKEPLFKRYVYTRIKESDSVPEEDLVNSGAEILGISPVTTSRYLRKLCSSAGLYEKVQTGDIAIIRFKKELEQT